MEGSWEVKYRLRVIKRAALRGCQPSKRGIIVLRVPEIAHIWTTPRRSQQLSPWKR